MLAHGRRARTQYEIDYAIEIRRQNPDGYVSVPAAGFQIGMNASSVYALVQTGELDGVYDQPRWYVEKQSIARYIARRATAEEGSSAVARLRA
ncbi:MAG TPA: hypothetical protein VGM82_18895 [Gemmatimonadaceae bacterium]|jgi:hypothetical protein